MDVTKSLIALSVRGSLGDSYVCFQESTMDAKLQAAHVKQAMIFPTLVCMHMPMCYGWGLLVVSLKHEVGTSNINAV